MANLYIWLKFSSCYGSITLTLGFIGRNNGLSTLCHNCRFPCQQRVLKTFPGPGYICSKDGVVWLWHLLVSLYIYKYIHYIFIYLRVYIHIYIYIYISLCMHMRVCIYVFMCIYIDFNMHLRKLMSIFHIMSNLFLRFSFWLPRIPIPMHNKESYYNSCFIILSVCPFWKWVISSAAIQLLPLFCLTTQRIQ